MATAAEAAKHFVSGPHVVEAARLLLSQFSLSSLCEALANARPEDAESLLSALERLEEFEEVRKAFLEKEVVGFLQKGAVAPDPRVRRIVAKLLTRLASVENSMIQLIDTGLLDACEELLLEEEVGTAEAAAGVICSSIQWTAGRQAVLAAGGDDVGLAQRLQGKLHTIPDVQRMRVLHLFVELGRKSVDAFDALKAHGAYKEVLDTFFTNDILLKLIAVELMEALGSYLSGQVFLSQAGVPARLASELGDGMCDDSVRLCVVRLLGLVLMRTPDTLSILLPNREAPLAIAIASLLEGRDSAGRLCALNAWANISENLGGLSFFLRWRDVLQTILSFVTAANNETAKGAMSCWTAVLKDWRPPDGSAMDVTDGGIPAEHELWDIAEKELAGLTLKNLSGKPFSDVRVQTWQLLAALVRSRPVAQRLLPAAEMRDLLLDFSSETASDARIAKHNFVVELQNHHSQWVGAFLDEKVEAVLDEYARQGPHWMPRGAATAVGDQSM